MKVNPTHVTWISITSYICLNKHAFLFLISDSLIECTPLLNIPYGHVHYSSVDSTKIQPGDVVTYSCDPPYRLEGAEYRICMNNGSWSEEQPQCTGEPSVAIENHFHAW